MCGIVGVWQRRDRLSGQALGKVIERMAETVRHRGPDASGAWVDEACGMALGHRRLSVVDLSQEGAQPMLSSCGRMVIVYNGEVYNAPELRAELESAGRTFRGHSDTEVIVEACAEWGVEPCVRRLIGMFAIGVWDIGEGRLTLVRDRLGIKPLYWSNSDALVIFGSELKPFHRCPGFSADLDGASVASFMRHGYVPAPHSIYRGVRKLEPGCMVTLHADGRVDEVRYWSLHALQPGGDPAKSTLSDAQALEQTHALLLDAVERRMVADVPLGAFLSGGIDSSLVVALMQSVSPRPVKTFTIGFGDDNFDEAPHARGIAEALGTDHTELYVEASHAWETIPRLPDLYDEPFADSSQIPTYLVSELTRQHVTVSLSGDGGDELFAGYNRYLFGHGLARRLALIPRFTRRAMGGALRSVSPSTWNTLGRYALPHLRPFALGDKLHKLAGVLCEEGDGLYRALVSQWQTPRDVVQGCEEHRGILWDESLCRFIPDAVERMQFIDTLTYLPDDILTKVDRASMAVSLEARVPLLDHRVVEHAQALPARFKIRHGRTKWILRELLARHVPGELFERPKMGFGIPLGGWMRGPLREWAEGLLAHEARDGDGMLDMAHIMRAWHEHVSGVRDWQYPMWTVLMFLAWKERWT